MVILAVVALCVYLVDQIAKVLVVANLYEGQRVEVLGQLLQFNFVKNAGAAFSIGSGSTWIFSIVGVGVLGFVIWYAPRIKSTAWAILFGLLLGGLLGNLTDRLFREPGFGVGHVVDFLQIPVLPAIFNLADVAIVSSMALFLILTIRGIGLDGRRTTEDEDADELDDAPEVDSADAASEAPAAAPVDAPAEAEHPEKPQP
ncbi:signal peptidase II [Leifsonia naganoensis]|uniref:Lipoprotein signal peptidase n=1 Tax=Leifsonia naganoensis TaxID=150025 RepID=A0A853DY99_9MICO|nr:signal peptidase II [Leifsonia naganoensis]NYK11465.1 signal peptidase II [Leifsonia naganoensis]